MKKQLTVFTTISLALVCSLILTPINETKDAQYHKLSKPVIAVVQIDNPRP